MTLEILKSLSFREKRSRPDKPVTLPMLTTRCGVCSFTDRKSYYPPPIAPKTFTSNEPSPSSDTFTLRQSLSKTRRELERVNAEMELAEAAITRMKATCSRLLLSVLDDENALRPILSESIPDDILQLIFEWAVHLNTGHFLSNSRMTPPWTISHTCSRWRSLAISHHPLWYNIDFVLQGYKNTAVPLLELSLQRFASTNSGFVVRSGMLDRGNDWFKNVLAPHLESTSRRWHRLDVYTSCHFLNNALDGWSFERLTELRLSCSHNNLHTIITAFRDTPRLVRLCLSYLSSDHQLDIPWGQLVFYESEKSDLRVLSQLSAVQTLIIGDKIEYRHPQTNWPDIFDFLKPKAPIRLPSLHSLSLQTCLQDDNCLTGLSDILEVPSLHRLHVSFEDVFSHTTQSPNIRFLEHLTHLSITISSYNVPENYLLDFLRCASSVRVLYLGNWAFNSSVLRALQDAHILPLLECLQINDQERMDRYAADIITIVEGRKCRLQLIDTQTLSSQTQWQRRVQKDVLIKWRSLCEQGVITVEGVNREFQFDTYSTSTHSISI